MIPFYMFGEKEFKTYSGLEKWLATYGKQPNWIRNVLASTKACLRYVEETIVSYIDLKITAVLTPEVFQPGVYVTVKIDRNGDEAEFYIPCTNEMNSELCIQFRSAL